MSLVPLWAGLALLAMWIPASYANGYIQAECYITHTSGDPTKKIHGAIVLRQKQVIFKPDPEPTPEPEGGGNQGCTKPPRKPKLPINPNPVIISVALSGFQPNVLKRRHGMHIHVNGNLGNQCQNAGGHYGLPFQDHGAPTDRNRHLGDLGNIETDECGVVHHYMQDTRISLQGRFNVIGRSIVIHAGEDDLGRGPPSATGNAGSRLGCCVIREIPDSTGF